MTYPTPDQIYAARKAAHLTQEEAGELIGYTRRAWQSWECGERRMRGALFEQFKLLVQSTKSAPAAPGVSNW